MTAFKKYGIEHFEITVLKSFHDSLGWRTKVQLDELEKKYITEYDSFNNGYNSTLGDDGEVLGHTEETKEHLREVRIQQESEKELDKSNWVLAKNLETNAVVQAESIKKMSELIKVSDFCIRKCLNGKQLITNPSINN